MRTSPVRQREVRRDEPIVGGRTIPLSSHLSYSDKCIGDDGARTLCAALSTRTDITSLDLRGCHIHALGAAALAELLLGTGGRTIESISLEWNALGTSDAGPRAMARALCANASLTHLDLRNNRIGAGAIASLAEGLQSNTTLLTLDLRWNSAGDSGAHALEQALAHNGTLLRLPLQGNRVPEATVQRIDKLLARNGAAHDENQPPEADAEGEGAPVPPLSVASSYPNQPLRDAVHTRTLESTLVVQQNEFTNKLKHAVRRAEAAEEALGLEQVRADGAVERAHAAEEREGQVAAELVLARQEVKATQDQAAADVATAQLATSNAEHEAARAAAAERAAQAQLTSRDARLELELKAIADREERAQQAEARAAASDASLDKLNEKLLGERREHVASLQALQERLAQAERRATETELRLAAADTARAEGITESLRLQAERHEGGMAKLRAELLRMEEADGRHEAHCDQLRAETERVRAEVDARVAASEASCVEREARATAQSDARLASAAAEKEAMAQAHRDALAKLREAEEARWTAHEAKLTSAREEHSELERKLHAATAETEAASRELIRSQAEAADAAAAEAAVREQLGLAKTQAAEQHEAVLSELASTRRLCDEKLAAAAAEAQALTHQLLESQRELQASQTRFEATVQGLQLKVVQTFQDAVSASRAATAPRLEPPTPQRTAQLADSSPRPSPQPSPEPSPKLAPARGTQPRGASKPSPAGSSPAAGSRSASKQSMRERAKELAEI